MNPLLRLLLSRVMAPAGDEGSDTGGTAAGGDEDRGDVLDPTLTVDNLEALVQANADGSDADHSGPDDAVADAAGEGDDTTDEEQARHTAAGIPKGRFNEVNARRKAAEAELATTKQELARYREQEAARVAAAKAPSPAPAPAAGHPPAAAPAGPLDVEAEEAAYIEALLEGDKGAAITIRRRINTYLQEEASTRATQQFTQRQTAQLLEKTAQTITAAYPWLNQASSAEVLELIMASRDRKIAGGMPAHLALAEAADTIAPRFAPADTPSGDLPEGGKGKDTRSAAALARGAADSTAQPPSIQQAGIGQRATAGRVNVSQLTEEQFEALTPAEKRRLRGD